MALNLRVDEAMSLEIKRIGGQKEMSDSETARMLIDWGIEAHRAREAALLSRRYDAGAPETRDGSPMVLQVTAQWVAVPSWDDEE